MAVQHSTRLMEPHYGPRLPTSVGHLKQWLADHHMTLMAINDTPHSIALGSAIGIFFGFTTLWSMKTLLLLAVAWVCRSNQIAAAIGGPLHDVILPLMPAVFWWEYKVGYWFLHGTRPHHIRIHHVAVWEYLHPNVFLRLIWPTLIGSFFLAVPCALATYVIMRLLLTRARRDPESTPDQVER